MEVFVRLYAGESIDPAIRALKRAAKKAGIFSGVPIYNFDAQESARVRLVGSFVALGIAIAEIERMSTGGEIDLYVEIPEQEYHLDPCVIS